MIRFQGKNIDLVNVNSLNYRKIVDLIDNKNIIPANTIALKINNSNVVDLESDFPCNQTTSIECITTEHDEYLDVMRHTAAHVLAQAVITLYPGTKISIGPVIKDGFYYDFDFHDSVALKEEDLEKIEKKMLEIVKSGLDVKKRTIDRNDAIKYFEKLGENYKVEIVNRISEDESVTMYKQGDFEDLCRGPHLPNTKNIGVFKLTQITRAYWGGDSSKKQLWRIYGTAWRNADDMKKHFERIEEAEKRYHVLTGQKMDLFHFQDEAPGAVFWHPDGWFMFQSVLRYIREAQNSLGYTEISTPEVIAVSLWESSGHWAKFREQMFITHQAVEKASRMYALKPMNCPGTAQVFKNNVVSYRDLPMRLSEFGKVFRYEPPGALHGLMRLRAFTQDDAHIFCTKGQMIQEIEGVCRLIFDTYEHFGFKDIQIKISTRPEQRVGSDEIWDESEAALIDAAKSLGLDYSISEGEGAFYGPKIEFTLQDAIDRKWQLGTVQVDFNLPIRLGINYTSPEGAKEHPIVIHRAIFGSIERFIGILLEHYNGYVPLSIVRQQVVIITVSDKHMEYARGVNEYLLKQKIRSFLDQDNNTLNYKIRKYTTSRTPIMIIIGDKEVRDGVISVRYCENNAEEVITVEKLASKVLALIQ